MNLQIITSFVIYAFILIFISYIFSRKSKNSSEFILGERSTNYWVTAIALQASDMSHWLFLGLPSVIYTFGLIRVWEIFGLMFFMFLNWHFIAPKIRIATEKLGTITLFSYFEKRFNDTSGQLRILTSVIAIVFFTFYISSGLVAMGRLFESAFGISYQLGIFLGLFTTITYTLIGGFVAVAWCDFFQGLFAVAMIILVPTVAYSAIGGWQDIVTAANTKGVSLSIIPQSVWQILSLFFVWGPGYFGQPHLLSFFMGIKDPKNIKYAKFIGLAWQAIVLLFATLIGLIGLAYFQNGGEIIYILLTKALFSPIIAGFILCAILAVTLSTLDSQILTSGSVIAHDIYKKILKKKASPKAVLWTSRLGSLSISLVAVYIAHGDSNTIYELVQYAWSGMGSAFGPLVIISLYSNKANKYGALAGIIVGALTSSLWPYFNSNAAPLIPGFLLSYVTIYAVSYITQKNHISK